MGQVSAGKKITGFLFGALKVVFFIAGGFLLYRNRKRVLSLVKNQNVVISFVYAFFIAFITLFYRLFVLLNSLLQQAR